MKSSKMASQKTYLPLWDRLSESASARSPLDRGVATDLEVNGEDPWAKEKFGEGDIRLISMKRPV
jgi:hypothetical protein